MLTTNLAEKIEMDYRTYLGTSVGAKPNFLFTLFVLEQLSKNSLNLSAKL